MTTPSEVHADDVEGRAGPGQQVGHRRAAHRGAAGVEQRQRDEDVQGAEGDDERREPEPGHQEPVQRAGGESDDEAREEGEGRGQPWFTASAPSPSRRGS